jgi:TPR repeat protein
MQFFQVGDLWSSVRVGTVLSTIGLLSIASLFAQSTLNRALEAYKEGNFHRAFELWKQLADSGDARAQDNLGVLFH